MKVYIGPYINWIGPYQIAEKLTTIGFSEESCFKIGEFLSKTYLKNICDWIHSFKKRKIKVKLHKYDNWSLDTTLAHVILPALIDYRKNITGTPFIDDEDIPENLKTEDFSLDAWYYIVDEMIFAFSSQFNNWEEQFSKGVIDIYFKQIEGKENFELVNGPNHTYKIDLEKRKKYQERIKRGYILFGKYYTALWT